MGATMVFNLDTVGVVIITLYNLVVGSYLGFTGVNVVGGIIINIIG